MRVERRIVVCWMNRTVTFTEAWGRRSWKVAYDGPYENTRDKHVEVCAVIPDGSMV